jgi:hypothetical protein
LKLFKITSIILIIIAAFSIPLLSYSATQSTQTKPESKITTEPYIFTAEVIKHVLSSDKKSVVLFMVIWFEQLDERPYSKDAAQMALFKAMLDEVRNFQEKEQLTDINEEKISIEVSHIWVKNYGDSGFTLIDSEE